MHYPTLLCNNKYMGVKKLLYRVSKADDFSTFLASHNIPIPRANFHLLILIRLAQFLYLLHAVNFRFTCFKFSFIEIIIAEKRALPRTVRLKQRTVLGRARRINL